MISLRPDITFVTTINSLKSIVSGSYRYLVSSHVSLDSCWMRHNQSHRKCKRLFYYSYEIMHTYLISFERRKYPSHSASVEVTPEKIHRSSLSRACCAREDGSKVLLLIRENYISWMILTYLGNKCGAILLFFSLALEIRTG